MTRAEQKVFFRTLYLDYDPKRHDVFVWRYRQKQEAEALRAYEEDRGIVPHSVRSKHLKERTIESMHRRAKRLQEAGIVVRRAVNFERKINEYGEKYSWVIDYGGQAGSSDAFQTKQAALDAAIAHLEEFGKFLSTTTGTEVP